MPGDHAAIVAPIYPVQRVIRTVLVDVVVWGPTLTLIVPLVSEATSAAGQAGILPAGLVARVLAIGATAVALSGALSRVIAVPAVNRILTKLGAGTVPRRAARAEVVEAVKGTQEALDAIQGRHAGP
jgi:hypothetical protein